MPISAPSARRRSSWACAASRTEGSVRSYPSRSPYPMVTNLAISASLPAPSPLAAPLQLVCPLRGLVIGERVGGIDVAERRVTGDEAVGRGQPEALGEH